MVIKQVKYKFLLHVTTFLSFFFSSVIFASPALIPSAPQVSASSYILMDAASGDVLIKEDSHKRLPPASLTKMMTAYIVEHEVAEGRINLYDEVPVSVKAWKTGGSKMFIKEGTKVVLEDLLKGVIIQSGNDASIALAEYVAGSELAFADIMNQQAKLLGMKDSHFENATGLPSENHYSTAYDLAILAKATIANYPEQYKLYAEKYFTYNGIRQPNRNRLLWRDKSVDGLKTGHTEEAGYCLVASAEREGMRLISVVMGTNSENARAQESQKLLNYGFRYFETHNLYKTGISLVESPVWLGLADTVQLGLAKDVVITIPRGQKDQLKAELLVDPVVKAPLNVGQNIGTLEVSLKGEVLVSEPLVALEPVPEAGFFKRIWDSIKLFFIGLFS
jgi:D-alanyl-D-alanine carboxypeptidase (penicillin-binding protein 5/6)|tara:strand:+ start:449 stop:1621 length:1173 start_codon:yes stop_codon:yes gene_type:complete